MTQRRDRHALHALLICVLAGLAMSAGAAPPRAMFRGNAALTGVYDAPPPWSLAGVRFTFKAGAAIRSTPVVAGGMVYFGSVDGVFHALDARDGREQWHVRTSGAINGSPAVAGGIVYFTSRDHRLHAVDARTGTQRWTRDLGQDLGRDNYWDYFLSSPTIDGGRVYVGGGSGWLLAFDATSGRPAWRYDAGARIRTTPAVSGGLVVFGTGAGTLHAVSQRTGEPRWRFATKGASHVFADAGNDTTSIVASPSIADGIVTVGGRDGMLYAVDLRTGKRLWQSDHDGSSWVLATAVRDGIVYSGSGSAQFVQAADLRSGIERWRFPTRGAVFSSLTLAGDVLLFGDFSGDVHAIDASDGAPLWTFPTGHRIFATPVVHEGIVYVASDDGVLRALDARPTRGARSFTVDKAVYWEGRRTAEAFSWFQNDVDVAILGAFKAAGYRQVDAAGLAMLMQQQAERPARTVVVFADNRMPNNVTTEDSGPALVRRYLDAGGKVVLLGTNPLAFVADPATGAVQSVDFTTPARIFGVTFAEPSRTNGYYGSYPTPDGMRWGLREPAVTYGSVDPRQDIVTLAQDEFGMASVWSKRYGGAAGTGLLQLSLPRQSFADPASVLAAIEFGVAW